MYRPVVHEADQPPTIGTKRAGGSALSAASTRWHCATIVLKHDTDLPRPYGRTNLVQGTRGIVRGFPEFKVCLEANGRVVEDHRTHEWEPGAKYLAEYEHPLWKQALEADERATPPDGARPVPTTAEFLEDSRLVQAIRAGVAPDFDVYDAATWSAVAPLSERSVAERSRPVDVPDLTRGRWKTNPPVRILGV